MGPWCVDLNATISETPELMKCLMKGLKDSGHEVHVVSGTHHDVASDADISEKHDLLRKLGFEQGVDYDRLIAVSGPEKNVPQRKVEYMRHVKAAGLIDNSKFNIRAARKAGFLGLRYVAPKGKKHG